MGPEGGGAKPAERSTEPRRGPARPAPVPRLDAPGCGHPRASRTALSPVPRSGATPSRAFREEGLAPSASTTTFDTTHSVITERLKDKHPPTPVVGTNRSRRQSAAKVAASRLPSGVAAARAVGTRRQHIHTNKQVLAASVGGCHRPDKSSSIHHHKHKQSIRAHWRGGQDRGGSIQRWPSTHTVARGLHDLARRRGRERSLIRDQTRRRPCCCC